MGALIIKADSQTNKLIKALAEKLGAGVMKMDEKQYEDFLLGATMDAEKTGENVSRERIMKALKKK